MSYEELKNYIKSQKEIGISGEDIKKALNEKSWDPELIDKAFSESNDDTEKIDSTTISSLVGYTWNSFTSNFWTYIKASLTATFLPLLSALILLAPIFYDVLILKFTTVDFISKPLFPIFVSYIAVITIIILLIAAYGNLIITTVAKNDGKIKLSNAMSDSWKKLPGYFWVNILSFFFIFISLLPSIALMVFATTLIRDSSSLYYIIPAALILLVPVIIFSIFLSFSVFSYVIDNIRGYSAIKNSFNLVKNNFLFVLGRLAFLWIVFMLIGQITTALPYTNFVLGLIFTPLSIIYLVKLYKDTKLITK